MPRLSELEGRLLQTPEADRFRSAELDGLTEPMRRHLTQALTPWDTAGHSAWLGMCGHVKVGRWAACGVCDMCGGRLVTRADDTPQAVRARLRDYHEKTRPVLELFRAKEVVVAVDATGSIAQVQAGIREHLGVELSST